MDDYLAIVRANAARYSVDPADILALIEIESGGDPNAFRAEPQINDASYGLMQLLGKTARSLGYTGDFDGLYDPATNIELGTRLWSQLAAQYGGDKQAMASAYNSGRGDAYQSNPAVASYVDRFLAALQAMGTNPESVGVGFAVVLTLLFLWRN